MRWIGNEMAIAYPRVGAVSRRCDNVLRYASHCSFDSVSMSTLADMIFMITRCIKF